MLGQYLAWGESCPWSAPSSGLIWPYVRVCLETLLLPYEGMTCINKRVILIMIMTSSVDSHPSVEANRVYCVECRGGMAMKCYRYERIITQCWYPYSLKLRLS